MVVILGTTTPNPEVFVRGLNRDSTLPFRGVTRFQERITPGLCFPEKGRP